MNGANAVTPQKPMKENTTEEQPRTLRAYKRAPGLSNSRWYKGLLLSQLAGATDNDGAFDFTIATVRPGTEPPPHVHSREDEFFYLLSGVVRFYVDGKVFCVTAGGCMFLPRGIPHAWLITSQEARMIAVITPAGFTSALHKMSAPAERLEIPSNPEIETYASVDFTETIKVFAQYGVRLLTPDETRREMPEYPI